MAEVPILQKKSIDSRVQFDSSSAGIIRQESNANERLSARLKDSTNSAIKSSLPLIKEETINQALDDVKNGKIDSESVALVARDTYRKTAEKSFLAGVEINAKNLGDGLVDTQTKSGRYSTQEINNSWSEFVRGSTEGLKDIGMKSSIKDKLNLLGQKYEAQVATLESKQQRTLQKKNLTAKLELDTEELKKVTGINPTRTLELQDDINDNIETMVNANFISTSEAEQLQISVNKSAYVDHTQRQFKASLSKGLDNANKFIEKFDKSNQPLLDEAEKLSTTNGFISQLSGLRRDAKNTITATNKTNKLDVDEGIKVLRSGKVPENKIELDQQIKTLSEKDQRAYSVASKVQSVRSVLSDKTLVEQEAYVNSKEADEISNVYGVEVLNEAKKVISNKRKLANNDPMSLAIQDGLKGFKDLPSVGVDDLGSLPDRLVLSAVTMEEYGTSPKLLTSAEAKSFTNYMDNPETTLNQKQLLISKINGYGSEVSSNIYRQVGGKQANNFAFSGRLASTGNTEASKLSLLGHNADIKLDPEVKEKIQAKLNGVFSNHTTDLYNQNVQGLLDYAKGRIRNGQEVDEDDLLEQTIGKSVKYNNKQTIIPFGVEQEDFEDWLDKIEIPDNPQLQKELQELTDYWFKRGSGDAQLHYEGAGKYSVQTTDINGDRGYVSNEAGGLFILDWNNQ